jgi:phospholipase/carboxylesterase
VTSTHLIPFEDWTLRIRPAFGPNQRLLLLLHGWTGDEDSMWPFARNLPANLWLVAPRAPHPADPNGYSWRARVGHGWPTLETMRESAAMLIDLAERWGIANAVDTSQVDVIGFSQGGAMGVTLSLLYPQRIRKLGVLAGFAPAGAEAFIPQRPLVGKQFFWAHGTLDKLVPIEVARASIETLESCGAAVQYCQSEIGHKVSAECLKALEGYVAL